MRWVSKKKIEKFKAIGLDFVKDSGKPRTRFEGDRMQWLMEIPKPKKKKVKKAVK